VQRAPLALQDIQVLMELQVQRVLQDIRVQMVLQVPRAQRGILVLMVQRVPQVLQDIQVQTVLQELLVTQDQQDLYYILQLFLTEVIQHRHILSVQHLIVEPRYKLEHPFRKCRLFNYNFEGIRQQIGLPIIPPWQVEN
jgi:hypothetical protein